VRVRRALGTRADDQRRAAGTAAVACRLAGLSPVARSPRSSCEAANRDERSSKARVGRRDRVFHSAIPFRSNLGLQLWLGNNENASEAWREQLHPIFNTEERSRYIQLGEVNYMQEKKREAIDYMLRHPAREAQLISSRFVAMWSGGTANPVDDFIRIPGLWFRGVLLFNLLLAAGTVAGIAVLWRRRSAYLVPIAVFPIVFPWAYYFTLAYPRYRLPVDPAVMLLTATALAAAFRPGEFAAGASEHR
jgi:hypothetical protein